MYATARQLFKKNAHRAVKIGVGSALSYAAQSGANKVANKVKNAVISEAVGGSTKWNKLKGRKQRFKKRSKKAIRLRNRKRSLTKLIRKVTRVKGAIGTMQYLCGATQTLSRTVQNLLTQDGTTEPFTLGDPRQITNAAAYLFKGKAAGGYSTLTGNFPVSTKINVIKMFMTIRLRNQTLYPVEVDCYTATGKNNSTLQFRDSWNAGYKNMDYEVEGTAAYTNGGAGNKEQDMYAVPGESKIINENFTYEKSSFVLQPGEQRLFYVKGRSGIFDPQKYVQPTSTTATPVYYQTIPNGWFKQVVFVLRSVIANVTANTSGTLTYAPLHSNTVKGAVIADVKKVYVVEAPEGTADAENVPTRKKQIYYSALGSTSNEDLHVCYQNPLDMQVQTNK